MAQTTTRYFDQEIIEIDVLQIEELKKAAVLDPLGRARICLHLDPDNPIHEMVIAFTTNSYSRPHRNVRNSKSYFIIEGNMLVLIFDNEGRITRKIELATASNKKPFFCRLNANCWHTVIAKSDTLVFLETNGGPFIKDDEEYASWAPAIDDHEGINTFFSDYTN